MRDSDLLPLSGLQHVVYCDRQVALIHVEQVWRENVSTTQGRIVHEHVDELGGDNRQGVRLAHAVSLRSDRLGVFGRADLVELHSDSSLPGGVRPYPVEVKRGRAKAKLADKVQLCAQAMCLEEMFGLEIPEGALYYAGSHRRVQIPIDEELRRATLDAAERFHELYKAGTVPFARYEPHRCDDCSLHSYCQPHHPGGSERASLYLERLLKEADG